MMERSKSQSQRNYPMKSCYRENDSATKDVSWILVFVISVSALVTLESLASSVWLRLKHNQLERRLQLEKGYLDVYKELFCIGNDDYDDHDDEFDESGSFYHGENNDTFEIVQRVKREDRRNRNNRNRKRHGGRRGKGRQSGVDKDLGYHLVVDSGFSQPDSPKLTTEAETPIRYWKVADTEHNRVQRFATLESDGTVTIKKSGLYYIYSQITYYDRSGSWSHRIDINQRGRFKCIATEWGVGTDPDTKMFYNIVHQCITGGVANILKGQKVAITSMYPRRIIHADSDVTFWGIMQLFQK